jgi:hypothetical protein
VGASTDNDEPEIPVADRPAALSERNDRAGARPRRPTGATGATGSDYGIENAIALMRTLPSENVELVVQVVKHTLESARIDIGAIIEDATEKQQRIEARVSVLKGAIADLEREIETRKTEIGELETDHRETSAVKERLVLAEKLTRSAAAAPAAEAGSGPMSAPPRRQTAERRRPTAPPPSPLAATSAGASAGASASTPASASAPAQEASASSSQGIRVGSHTVVPKK